MQKTIIWDLDNTLYFETDEYKNKLNEATALAAINEFNIPLDFQTATDLVKESILHIVTVLNISLEHMIYHTKIYISHITNTKAIILI